MKLSNYSKVQLKALSEADRINLLKVEWEVSITNNELGWEFSKLYENNKDTIKQILELYCLKEGSSIVIESTDPNAPFAGKLNSFIFENSYMDESIFLYYLKLLYLNGYTQRVQVFDVNKMNLDADFHKSYYQAPTNTIPLEHNLKWLLVNHRELFKPDVLCNMNDKEKLKFGGLPFKEDDSPEEIYEKFLTYGTMADIVCSFNSITSLSNKGLYLLTTDSYTLGQNLLSQQQKMLITIQETKEEQVGLIEELQQFKEGMKKEYLIHEHKIKSFYKDIATILSILVAAFAVIGVNISAIPKIEENFMADILMLNLSLVLALTMMFFILKKLVFKFPGEKDDKVWYFLLIGCLAAIIAVYFVGDRYNDKLVSRVKSLNDKIVDQSTKINDLGATNSLLKNKVDLLEMLVEKQSAQPKP